MSERIRTFARRPTGTTHAVGFATAYLFSGRVQAAGSVRGVRARSSDYNNFLTTYTMVKITNAANTRARTKPGVSAGGSACPFEPAMITDGIVR